MEKIKKIEKTIEVKTGNKLNLQLFRVHKIKQIFSLYSLNIYIESIKYIYVTKIKKTMKKNEKLKL